MEIPQTRWLKQQTFTFTVLEAGKCKMKVPPDLVSCEGPLPGSQMTIFSLYPQAVEGVPFMRTLIPFMRDQQIATLSGYLLINYTSVFKI